MREGNHVFCGPGVRSEGDGQDGKPLAGAAKTSFLKKCEADAEKG